MYLLVNNLLSDDKLEMCNNSLSEFCKLYKVEDKDHMSYERMNTLLITNQSNLTDVFAYSIQDVVVLDQLFKKTQILTKSVEFARMCDTNILDVFHKAKVQLLVLKLHSTFRQNNIQLRFDRKDMTSEKYLTENADKIDKYKGKYQGAANKNINSGFVYNNVYTIDYTSLYPSVIMYY